MSVLINATHLQVHVEREDGGQYTTLEVISAGRGIDLSALLQPQYTLGGQNPNTTAT